MEANWKQKQWETTYVRQAYGLDSESVSRLPPKFNEDFLVTDTSVMKFSW